MSTGSLPTLREALAAYRQQHGLPADEAGLSSWTCRIGPLILRLPNFGWRRRAIDAHDLHHLLTGYPCTMRGECRMAAWEFGAGPMPHWAAALFCLPLVLAGMFPEPRKMFSAFVAGRRSRSLHQAPVTDAMLAASVTKARAALARHRAAAAWSDRLRFSVLLLRAALVLLAPIALPIGLWIALRWS